LKNIALNALAILERPPCSTFFFDNLGASSDPQALGEYPVRQVNISDIVDLGERLPDMQPM
jgi:hypothetical protein